MNATKRTQKAAGWPSTPLVYTTYTVGGQHFRFTGRQLEQGTWYVHVHLLQLAVWVRVSYGYFPGRTLPEIAATWAQIFQDAGCPRLAYVPANN